LPIATQERGCSFSTGLHLAFATDEASLSIPPWAYTRGRSSMIYIVVGLNI
jgi:hypothetical protein